MSGASERFKRAEQAAKKGNYEYAIELYLQGLQIDPKAVGRRRLHEVEALAIESAGGNPEGGMAVKVKTMGILGKAKKLQMQKKWDEMVIELERAIRHAPRNTSLLIQLADGLIKTEAVDGALDVLEEVVAYDRTNIEAFRRLGQIHGGKENIERAIECWEKVRALRPEDKEAAKAIRDLSAANMVRQAEAKKVASGDDSFKALLADQDKSAELEAASKVLRTDDDRRKAIVRKKEELRAEPTNSRLWRDLAALYTDLREYRYAFAAYKKALEVNAHDMFARDKIGQLKERMFAEKVEALEKQVAEAEKNGGAPSDLIEQRDASRKEFLEFKLGEYGRRVVEHPTDYSMKLHYGELLMEAEKFDEAIEQFQKAVSDPKFKIAAQNLMGLCFYRKGLFPVAVTQLGLALDAVQQKGSELGKEIRYNLAIVHEAAGDREKALKHYQEIMAIDIGYEDVSARVTALMVGS